MNLQAKTFRRTRALALTGFFSSFCECGFKVWAVLAVLGSSFDYFRDSAFLLSLTAVWILPPILLPSWSGFLADRLPKRYVIITVKLLDLPVLLLGGFAMSRLDGDYGGILILLVVLLQSVLNAFFIPAFYGLQPESFSAPELSRSCGKIGSVDTLGLLAGGVVIPFAFRYDFCFWILFAAVFAAIVSAISIVPVISAVQRRRELIYRMPNTMKLGLKGLFFRPGVAATAAGEVVFIGLSVATIPLLILFGRNSLGITDPLNMALLQFSPLLGFVLGCFLGGKFSGSKIELGLVPLGALGMAAALPLMVFCPGEGRNIVVSIPGGVQLHLVVFAGAWFWAFFAGLSGGVFVIPLRSFVLQSLRPELRGAALALKNAVAFAFGSVILLLAVACALGDGQVPDLPDLLQKITDAMPRISFQVLLTGFGLAIFIVTAFSMWLLPNFLLRFLILALGHSFYRLRINGAENIPERGAALLLSNHVSAIDSVLISACTSRQIRFLLDENFFSLPLLGSVARMTGFFKVPSAGKSKSIGLLIDQVRKHLSDGGLVCVFPEGRLSRNGLMGEFKQGYERMLPENTDVPIIPVNISFAWGSVFSFRGTSQGRFPFRFRLFSVVSFGKPLPRSTPAFEIRQKIAEMAAEAAGPALPGENTLHCQAVAFAKKHPFRKLFSDHDRKESSVFKTVRDAALLSRLIRHRVPYKVQYVGILLPNSTAAAQAILGVMMADRTPVPLNYSTSQQVFDCSVEKAGINLIITSRAFLEKIRVSPGEKAVCLEDLALKISIIRKVIMTVGMAILPTREFMNMISPLSAFDLSRDAALLFSSGSTGNPKGVRLSHHNLNSNARSVASGLAVTKMDKVVGNLPLFHSFGLNVCFWLPVMQGVPVVYIANPLDGSGVRGIISGKKATMLFATPSFLQKYLQRCSGEELQNLRLVATGAEKLRADISEKVRTLTDGRLQVVECYGCTELSPVVSINIAPVAAETGSRIGQADSIGIPLENISVRILDPLQFTPVEPGEEGILCVKGPLVMKGYLGDEDQSREVMAGEYYKTGDIAKMDKKGYISICGRLSRFSKIAGEMVPHEMVERIINEMCACGSRVVAVGGIPDPVKGEALLVLYTDDMPLTPEEIVDQLRERSISNLWIPKAKNFRKVEQLPLLGSGKLDLSLLRRMSEEIAAADNAGSSAGQDGEK